MSLDEATISNMWEIARLSNCTKHDRQNLFRAGTTRAFASRLWHSIWRASGHYEGEASR